MSPPPPRDLFRVTRSLTRLLIAAAIPATPAVAFAQTTPPATVNLLKNSSFENPYLGASPPPTFGSQARLDLPYYAYPEGTRVASWIYGANVGIINTATGSNPFYGHTSPSGFVGKQYAFVQANGTLSQAFMVKTAGTYELSWRDAGRPNGGSSDGNQTYDVMLNGNTISTHTTSSGQNFMAERSQLELNPGKYILSFAGETASGDHTAFIDKVRIIPAS